MILKSYEISKIKSLLNEKKIILLYGENYGLKKEIQESIKLAVNKKNIKLDELNLYENEIIKNDENFYDLIYSGSLFSNFKIISIQNASDKITSHIENIEKKTSNDVYIILFAEVLEKKSKLRSFFESSNNVICVPCYLDSEKDLIIAAQMHLKKKQYCCIKRNTKFTGRKI